MKKSGSNFICNCEEMRIIPIGEKCYTCGMIYPYVHKKNLHRKIVVMILNGEPTSNIVWEYNIDPHTVTSIKRRYNLNIKGKRVIPTTDLTVLNENIYLG